MASLLQENKKRKFSKRTRIVMGTTFLTCCALLYFTRVLVFGLPEKKLPITEKISPESSLNLNLVYQKNDEEIRGAEKIVIEGERAYISENIGNQFILILDISNPESPVVAGKYHESNPSIITDLKAQGNLLYLSYYYTGILEIIDVTEANNPIKVWEFQANGLLTGIIPYNNYLYLTDDKANLYIIDTQDHAHPQLVKVIENFNNMNNIEYAIANENLLFVVNKGLFIFDISSPTNPIEIGSYRLPLVLDSFDDIIMSNKSLWVRAEYGNLFKNRQWQYLLLDISNPSKPHRISTYERGPSFSNSESVLCFYDALILREHMYLMDFSNPTHPIELGYISRRSFDLGRPQAITKHDKNIYIYSGDSIKGFKIIKYTIAGP